VSDLSSFRDVVEALVLGLVSSPLPQGIAPTPSIHPPLGGPKTLYGFSRLRLRNIPYVSSGPFRL